MIISKKLTKSVVGIFCSALMISTVVSCRTAGDAILTNVSTTAFAVVPNKNRIDVINTQTNEAFDSLFTDEKPSSIAVSPDARMILATNSISGTVSVFLRKPNDTFQKLNSVGSGTRPAGIVFNPKFPEAYVAYEGDGRILVLDTRSVTASPRVVGVVTLQGAAPKKMVISPDGTRLFVTDSANAKLLVLTKTGTNLIKKSGEVSLVANSLAGSANSTILEGIVMTKQEKVYIADYTRDTIMVVDGKQSTGTPQSINLRSGTGANLSVNSNIGPKNMTVYTTLAGKEKIYVAGYNASIISSIDVQTSKVVNIPLTGSTGFQGNTGRDSYNPIGVAVANFNGKDFIYATNSSGLSLSMIDPETDRLQRNTSTSFSAAEQEPFGEIVSAGSVTSSATTR